MRSLKDLKSIYESGQNISEFLRREFAVDFNDEKIIEITYDLQSGKYIDLVNSPALGEYIRNYTSTLAGMINSLGIFNNIMEAGIGEATTFSFLMKALNQPQIKSYGFDISWSRIAFADKYIYQQEIKNSSLCTGSLFNIPFLSNSIDLVYTSHSIEPNGGNEIPILKELYRIASKYLVLLEPGYEFASSEAKERMEKLGYCKNIYKHCVDLGYKVIEHKIFPVSSRPLNPTAITIIEKNYDSEIIPTNVFACPLFKTPLNRYENEMFSPDSLMAYPIIRNIPCLRIENGIIAVKFLDNFIKE